MLDWKPSRYVPEYLLRYDIQYAKQLPSDVEDEIAQTSTQTLSLKVSGLEPNTEYKITVVASTKDGKLQSKGETKTCHTTKKVPPSRPDFDFTIMHSSSDQSKAKVLINWKPDLESGHPGSSFNVGYKLLGDDKVFMQESPKVSNEGLMNEVFVDDLLTGQTYAMQVFAFDNSGLYTSSQTKDVYIFPRPIEARFETSNEEEMLEDEYSSTTETKCSVPCGIGVKTLITMTCKRTCFPDCCKRKVEEVECQIAECRNVYGPWTEWSECSKPCVSSLEERSIKTRTRFCSGCDDTAGI